MGQAKTDGIEKGKGEIVTGIIGQEKTEVGEIMKYGGGGIGLGLVHLIEAQRRHFLQLSRFTQLLESEADRNEGVGFGLVVRVGLLVN